MSSRRSDASAAQAAARYAASHVRSTRDVDAFLARRGLVPSARAAVLAQLRQQDLLNDAACARLWAEQWAREGYAWSAIHAKLTGKGLEEPAIAVAARSVGDEAADPARARAALASRRASRAPRLIPADRVRLSRWLASRGFDEELISQVLDQAGGRVEARAARAEE